VRDAGFPENARALPRSTGDAEEFGCLSHGSEWITSWRRRHAGEGFESDGRFNGWELGLVVLSSICIVLDPPLTLTELVDEQLIPMTSGQDGPFKSA